MTIYRTLLARGYFPKELPPAFYTDRFAQYATSKQGRAVLEQYKPADNFTYPVDYRLARPGNTYRELAIPHPASYSTLARLVAKYLRRLLKKSSRSPFCRSRPVYASDRHRALHPSFKPANLAREKTLSRAGKAFLLKTDVSHFYPSLYTHAVGWAVDPKLRERKHWRNRKLLGKKLDQALMDQQGKVSQGIPIGPDISFLLSEAVLAQVDNALKLGKDTAYRWYDDYEISCNSRREAEHTLSQLNKELRRFNLRVNDAKTSIEELPVATRSGWQDELLTKGTQRLDSDADMVAYFDTAFRLRTENPDASVLMYAIGILFRLRIPSAEAGPVAESCITQALLSEPGVAQKAFSLLTFWNINGYSVNIPLLTRTITQLVVAHEHRGGSSDIAWALSFCIDIGIELPKAAGQVLSDFDDDIIMILALHMRELRLLRSGFTTKHITVGLKQIDLDGAHWLVGYEALRHGWLKGSASAVKANALFSDLLKHGVTFYRDRLPAYSSIVHPGGAPEWVVRVWLKDLVEQREIAEIPVLEAIREDLEKLGDVPTSHDEMVTDLLDILEEEQFAALVAALDPYHTA